MMSSRVSFELLIRIFPLRASNARRAERFLLIKITNMNPSRGRICCTFTATVGDLALPGCALIRRGDGYSLSVPRIGAPGETRTAPLTALMEAELLRVAVAHYGEMT